MIEVNQPSTEQALVSWRGGQIAAERLCAGLLHLEGYTDVDPQAPLGGADGLKDVLCRKRGRLYVAASYFTVEPVTFAKVRRKFIHDLKGVSENHARGIAFFTNNRISIGQRKELSKITGFAGNSLDVFNVERIRTLLDSPRGFSLRLQHLGLAMTAEDQLAFFAEWNHTMATELTNADGRFDELSEQFWELKEAILTKHDYPRRSQEEIVAAEEEFFDKVWFDRHMLLRERVVGRRETVDPKIWKGALASARRVIRKYGRKALGPHSDFDWGMINGKLSALRWVMGDEWDMLDT